MGKLPFESVARDTILKEESETDSMMGRRPEERPVPDLIEYGVVNIDKPAGPTSHQVSDYVQRILGIGKSGHAGTLDPNVTGVLPIALQRATRIVQALLPAGKEYVCIMHIHKDVEEKKIRKVFEQFTGKIMQLPPIKSAVKREEREREVYYQEILEIDGKDVIGQSAHDIANQIRGDIDTQVILTIERKGVKRTFTLTRDIINIGYTQAKRLDNAIYVDINLFTALSFIDFTQSIQEQIAKNPDFKGFIIDLRNNPGGYLESVKSIMGHFVPYGEPLLYIKTGPNTLESHLSQGKGEWEDYPVVILINQESASASEIMALTLLERNHISLVGETSYGKGTVQQVINYQDRSSLKLTIAEWQSLNQTSINNVGIEPTISVAFTSNDVADGRDPQLDAARAELKRLTR